MLTCVNNIKYFDDIRFPITCRIRYFRKFGGSSGNTESKETTDCVQRFRV